MLVTETRLGYHKNWVVFECTEEKPCYLGSARIPDRHLMMLV